MAVAPRPIDHWPMTSEPSFHRIEDDLAGSWIEDWAATGVAEIEAYLAKYADFVRFLSARDATLPSPE